MAMNVSRSSLEKLKESAERMKIKYANTIKKGEEIVEAVVHTAEVAASSFGFGVLDGRYGGVDIVGVPLTLLAGAGLHTAGFFMGASKAAPHLHGFGDGAIAAFAHKMGHGTGKDWRKGAGEKALPGDGYDVAGEIDGKTSNNKQLPEGSTRETFPGSTMKDADLQKVLR